MSRFRVIAGTTVINLYDPAHAYNQLRNSGARVDSFYGLANSFTHRCRGPLPSEGFFLVDRERLEVVDPSLFSETKTYSSGKSSWSVRIYDFNGDLHETYFNLYPVNVYAIKGSKLPAGYSSYWDTSSFVESDSNDWGFKKQLYVVHLADDRYWKSKNKYGFASYTETISATSLEHYINCKVPRPFTVGSEDLSLTNQTDVLDYENTKNSAGRITNWQELIDRCLSGWTIDHSSADYPTSIGNLDTQEYSKWQILWGLLDEIAHTLVMTNNSSNSYDAKIVPLGDTTGSSLSNEKTTFSKYLMDVSNSGNPVLTPTTYKVHFPTNGGEVWETNLSKGLSSMSLKTEDVQSSSLGVSYDSQELDGSTVGLKGRILYLRGGIGRTNVHNANQVQTHANELAKLHLKKSLWEQRNSFLRESYSGFCGFTVTKDLLSISWVSAGAGPTTIISSPSFSVDNVDTIPVSILGKDNTISIPNLPQKLPPQYWKEYRFFMQIGTSDVVNGDTFTADSGDINWATHGATDSSGSGDLTVYNVSGTTLKAQAMVEVYWSRINTRWETATTFYQADSTSATHTHSS